MAAPSRSDDLAAAALDAAEIGGRIVAEWFGRAHSIEAKAPGDYVSVADHESEDAIRESLARETPGIPFFGEERGGERAALGWVVDPLDGTANFLHGFKAVGVSVALVEDGRPVGEGICATGFPFKAKDRLPVYLRAFGAALGRFEDLRRPGAATLDLAWVSSGVFDGFFELGLGPWDVAAGALLVREAGGVVTDWKGDESAWLEDGDILAGPPAVHEALLAVAAEAEAAQSD
jgi:myo-inositol-1(or 4)-monophosphatase